MLVLMVDILIFMLILVIVVKTDFKINGWCNLPAVVFNTISHKLKFKPYFLTIWIFLSRCGKECEDYLLSVTNQAEAPRPAQYMHHLERHALVHRSLVYICKPMFMKFCTPPFIQLCTLYISVYTMKYNVHHYNNEKVLN